MVRMGGSSSCPLPRYGCCIRPQNPNRCKENHTSTPKIKGHRRNLSAAFNLGDSERDFSPAQLDINKASAEELMTLPGINRATAQNIVEYRRQLGGFKKVEDIALVSGVGATKLNHIRLEICVTRKKSSQNSSPHSSQVDMSVQDDVSRASASGTSSRSQGRSQPAYIYTKTNINTANVFQLMKVKGITQSLAEHVVAYRDRKGEFRRLDSLIKVKGIRPAFLSAIRPYLCVYDEDVITNTVHMNGTAGGGGDHTQITAVSHTLNNNTLSASQEDLISVYGPLSKKSFRSRKKPVLFRKYGRHVVRIGTWNLQRFDIEKAENPGVKEVTAMSILENGFSLLVVQELLDSEALQKICDELNAPTIPCVRKWGGHQGSWKCITSDSVASLQQGQEHIGFLYDVSRGIECKSVSVVTTEQTNNKHLVHPPSVAVFKVKDWEVVVAGLHLTSGGTTSTEMGDIITAIHSVAPDCKDVLVCGDFFSDPNSGEFEPLRAHGYTNAVIRDKYTNISTRNPEGSRCCDNLWMSSGVHHHYSGQTDVVREGMCSPWIPDGWGWGGVVSSHCPAWSEFYIDAPNITDPGLEITTGDVTKFMSEPKIGER